MNNEEKILNVLVKLTDSVENIGRRMDRMEQRMDRMEQRMDHMEQRMDRMESDISGIKVRLDVDVQRQLNLLSEGHTRLAERLDTLEEVKELAEKTKDRVDVIYSVVKRHSGEIAELKRA